MPKCTVKKCNAEYYAKGFCERHYKRNAKYGDPLAGVGNHAPPEQRFWRFVSERKPGKCWVFSGGGKKSRYGQFQVNSENRDHTLAHRYSYQIHHGKIPDGKVVMHSCDNPRCVNPAHLSVGTAKENTQDMIVKGRHARQAPLGNDNGKAILTPKLVRMIRSSSETNISLAQKIGVSINAVRGVRIKRTWAHIK